MMLRGLRVLDFSWAQAGPVATQLLADLGADVIKIERPDGDITRSGSTRPDGTSWIFDGLNRGKRSVMMDLSDPTDHDRLLELADSADVIVENFKPGTMAKFGLDAPTLRARNPQVVYASCSGFGPGPDADAPAFDLVIQAMSGLMSLTGDADGEPALVPFSPGDIGSGLYLAIGILAALARKREQGVGALVEVSMIDCQLALLWESVSRYVATGQEPQRQGNRSRLAAPYQAFGVADGFVVIAVGTDGQFRRLCEALGLPQAAADPRFATAAARLDHSAELIEVLQQALETLEADAVVKMLRQVAVPVAKVATVAEVTHQTDYARSMLVDLGDREVVGTPIKVDGARMWAPTGPPDLTPRRPGDPIPSWQE